MEKKWWMALNIFVLTIISLALVLTMWNFSFKKISPESSPKCVDLSKEINLTYKACFDIYSKNILLEVKRGQDDYNIKRLRVSFFDFSQKSYELGKVPTINNSKSYKILADKNPGSIEINPEVIGNFLFPVCENSKKRSEEHTSELQSH